MQSHILYVAVFVPLQKKFDSATEKYGAEIVVDDGIHPCLYGQTIIADRYGYSRKSRAILV